MHVLDLVLYSKIDGNCLCSRSSVCYADASTLICERGWTSRRKSYVYRVRTQLVKRGSKYFGTFGPCLTFCIFLIVLFVFCLHKSSDTMTITSLLVFVVCLGCRIESTKRTSTKHTNTHANARHPHWRRCVTAASIRLYTIAAPTSHTRRRRFEINLVVRRASAHSG